MIQSRLRQIADLVAHRAQEQGFVLADDVRAELTRAGLSEKLWKDVLALGRFTRTRRQGRTCYVPAADSRAQEELRLVHQAVRRVVRQYQRVQTERRQQTRHPFIQPVLVESDQHRTQTFLTRDLSLDGIRLIGTRSLLGQRVRVLFPEQERADPRGFVVRILWTCGVGEDLFENGGTLLEVIGG